MQPAWLTNDIKLVGGEVVVVGQKEAVEEYYKLKNRIEFISRNQPNHIQLAQKACLQLITKMDITVLGVDCEWNWRKSAVAGVDLIQIATPSVNILLHNFDRLPPELIKILGNEHIKKVGVNVAPDLARIGSKYGINVTGDFDLRKLKSGSLDKLCRSELKRRLDKSDHVRMSDWSSRSLSQRQITYAAADAETSLLLYHHFSESNVS